MNEKEALLGTPVRLIYSGHQVTAILTHYDASSDSYDGAVFGWETIKVQTFSTSKGVSSPSGFVDIMPVFKLQGLRAYPYSLRPNYEFQFVLPGESLQPVIDIINANIQEREAASRVPTEEAPAEQVSSNSATTQPLPVEQEVVHDPRDTDGDGIVSNAEKHDFKQKRRQ